MACNLVFELFKSILNSSGDSHLTPYIYLPKPLRSGPFCRLNYEQSLQVNDGIWEGISLYSWAIT
jgi:hypothetical protein